VIAQALVRAPGRLQSLGAFAADTGAAKSTLSEDIAVVARALRDRQIGDVHSVPGAAGGVVYRPVAPPERRRSLADRLCQELNDPERRLPGGFLFTSDLIFSPVVAADVGELFAAEFAPREPEAVVTVETKGIPLALMTAHALGVPLVAARRDSRVTEGPAIGLNYVSGSSRIATMSLPRRALSPGRRVLLVDDFLKGGGTALGMSSLMAEFGCVPVGIAVLIETSVPERKLVEDYFAVLRLLPREDGGPWVTPSPRLAGGATP
jgi:purine operon repressor